MNSDLPKICVIGLPSSGKSSFVNSISNKRLAKTGIARTTSQITYYGKNQNNEDDSHIKCDIISDDGYDFELIDLPGVSDAQDIKKEFDELTEKTILCCDVILWISDSRTAFLHSYEKEYFDKLLQIINKHCLEEGAYIKICIVLSKYESIDVNKNTDYKNKQLKVGAEIEYDDEETTYEDIANNVINMYKDIKILKYSSFSKIIYNKSSSEALVKLVSKQGINPPNINNLFLLGWYFENLKDMQNMSLVQSIIYQLNNIIRARHIGFKGVNVNPYISEQITKLINRITCNKSFELLLQIFLSDNELEQNELFSKISKQTITITYGELTNVILNLKINKNVLIIFNDIYSNWTPKYRYGSGKKERYIRLLGNDSIYYARYYYSNLQHIGTTPFTSVDNSYTPSYSALDVELFNNNKLFASKAFIEEIKKYRTLLWGINRDEDVSNICMLVLINKLDSLFEKIYFDHFIY